MKGKTNMLNVATMIRRFIKKPRPPIIWPEVTPDTPLEELIEIHKKIWDECIMTNAKPDTPYHSHCVACEIAVLIADPIYFSDPQHSEYDACKYCPLFCYEERCMSPGSPFDGWRRARSIKERKKAAKIIRDYKWREEKK